MYTKYDVIGLVIAGIGIFSGLSGFIAFMFVFGNVEAGIWAFFSGFYASATAFLFSLKMVEILDEWYGPNQLFRISLLGAAGAFCSFTATLCYICIVITFHEKMPSMSALGRSHIIMLVWSILSLKWSLTTAFVARKLSRQLQSGYQVL